MQLQTSPWPVRHWEGQLENAMFDYARFACQRIVKLIDELLPDEA
jgi:hypothetical protein